MSAEVVWVGWLVLFLVYEIVAAASKPKGDTFSENVWSWFGTPLRKAVLAVFLLTLTAHLVLGRPGGLAVILTGAPVGLVIGLAIARRRPAVLLLAVAVPLLLGADRCSIEWPWPKPTPTPSPSPTTEPSPTPSPTPSATPEPTPTPSPSPTPSPTPEPTPGSCTVSLEGSPVMGAGPHGNRLFDCTPKITNAERCTAVGMPGRITCPVTPEGDPQRYPCELKLMGGYPVWQLDVLGPNPGNLRWDYEEDPPWKARIIGTGRGRLRACYANQRACSAWIEVSY